MGSRCAPQKCFRRLRSRPFPRPALGARAHRAAAAWHAARPSASGSAAPQDLTACMCAQANASIRTRVRCVRGMHAGGCAQCAGLAAGTRMCTHLHRCRLITRLMMGLLLPGRVVGDLVRRLSYRENELTHVDWRPEHLRRTYHGADRMPPVVSLAARSTLRWCPRFEACTPPGRAQFTQGSREVVHRVSGFGQGRSCATRRLIEHIDSPWHKRRAKPLIRPFPHRFERLAHDSLGRSRGKSTTVV